MHIQTALQNLLTTIGTVIKLTYVALDGHFGNYPSAFMVRALNLHLISKLRSDAALVPVFKENIADQVRSPNMVRKSMCARWMKNT